MSVRQIMSWILGYSSTYIHIFEHLLSLRPAGFRTAAVSHDWSLVRRLDGCSRCVIRDVSF